VRGDSEFVTEAEGVYRFVGEFRGDSEAEEVVLRLGLGEFVMDGDGDMYGL